MGPQICDAGPAFRDVDALISVAPAVVSKFGAVTFKDAKGEERRAFDLTRDGFMLLAMGFSRPVTCGADFATLTADPVTGRPVFVTGPSDSVTARQTAAAAMVVSRALIYFPDLLPRAYTRARGISTPEGWIYLLFIRGRVAEDGVSRGAPGDPLVRSQQLRRPRRIGPA